MSRLSRYERQALYDQINALKDRKRNLIEDKNRYQGYIQDKYAQLNSGYRMERYQREALKNEIQGLKYTKEDIQRSLNECQAEINRLNGYLHS